MLPDEYSHIPHWSGGRTPSPQTSSLPHNASPGGKRHLTPTVVKQNEPMLCAKFSRDEGGVR
jgi:hypothetical protein